MPWQSVPPLLIITGAFTATGLGLRAVDYLAYGRVRDERMITILTFNMTLNLY